jgi:15-cis-phytoene synthase
VSTGVQQAVPQFTPNPSQLAIAYSVCRSIARSTAKNFYYAFLVLPRRKREALCAVYAFMRRCDDIADDTTISVQERRLKLADWLDSFHLVMLGNPTDEPVLIALADAQHKFRIPPDLLDHLAYGTAMDLKVDEAEPGINRPAAPAAGELVAQYKTIDDLYQYCYGVASVVGLVCIRIFGYRNPAAEPLAERCGLAFQLTNIIRDVKEDAAMGRVYLPQDDLEKFGLSSAELAHKPKLDRFRPLLELEADRARVFYHSADELIPLIDEDSQPALWVLVTIYRQLLDKIARRRYNVFSRKVSLTWREKFSILAEGFMRRLT